MAAAVAAAEAKGREALEALRKELTADRDKALAELKAAHAAAVERAAKEAAAARDAAAAAHAVALSAASERQQKEMDALTKVSGGWRGLPQICAYPVRLPFLADCH